MRVPARRPGGGEMKKTLYLDDLHPIIRETLAFADADHGATMAGLV